MTLVAVHISICFVHLVSPVLIAIVWSCEEQLMEWALCLPWLYCSWGTQQYSWETVLCPELGQEHLFRPRNVVVFPQETEVLCGWLLFSSATQNPCICWSWLELTGCDKCCPAGEGGVAGVWQPSCPHIVPSSDCSAQSSFPWAGETSGAALGSAALVMLPLVLGAGWLSLYTEIQQKAGVNTLIKREYSQAQDT